jgi:CRP/FNR family cyclic AMP-dependent transcriptional regulator
MICKVLQHTPSQHPKKRDLTKMLIETGVAFTALLTSKQFNNISMSPKDILLLHNAGITRNIADKKIIQVTDTTIRYVYLLQKGLIKISNISDDGKEIIKYILKPGNIFGELNLLDNEEDRHEIAVAMAECQVCFVPAETVKKMMNKDNLFRKNIHQSICKRIKRMEERMFSLMLKDVRERVLDFLKEFVSEFGYPITGGYQAKIILTHEDIAKITTTSRQSVTTSLVYFKKREWIDYDSQNLSVFNFQDRQILKLTSN